MEYIHTRKMKYSTCKLSSFQATELRKMNEIYALIKAFLLLVKRRNAFSNSIQNIHFMKSFFEEWVVNFEEIFCSYF